MNSHPIQWLAATAVVVSLAAGCKPPPSAATGAPPPPTVTVAEVEQRPVVESAEFTGRIEAVESVEVRPRISGHLIEVRFKSGQLVRKGDVLFVIDPRWQKADVDRRQAEVEAARVRLENTEREAQRTPQLLEGRAISKEEAEARTARFREARAALLAAEAALNSARLDLEHTEVRAPINGRVSRALLTEGNYVSGNAGSASLLTTIVSVDPVYVYADVDEQSWLRLDALLRQRQLGNGQASGVTVELQLANEQGFPRAGRIESFDNRLDAGTGSMLLRAVVPNPDGAIVPGLFARLRIPISGSQPALLVQEVAIGTDQSQKFVLALTSSNTVEYRPVVLGPMVDGRRVVRSGVNPGDRVVVNGLQRVRPGMPVKAEAQTPSAPVKTAQR